MLGTCPVTELHLTLLYFLKLQTGDSFSFGVQEALKKENRDTQGNYRSSTWDMILGQNGTSSWSQANCEREQFPRNSWMSFLSVTRAGISRSLNVRKYFYVPAIHTFLYLLIHSVNFLEWQLNEKKIKRKEDMSTPKLWRRFVIGMGGGIRGRGVWKSPDWILSAGWAGGPWGGRVGKPRGQEIKRRAGNLEWHSQNGWVI